MRTGAVPGEGPRRVVDHSVHGIITIRLVDPSPEVVEHVVNTLGPSRGEPGAVPDISVTFASPLPSHSRLRLLGLNQAAFDDRHFYLLDAAGRRTRIDFEALDGGCELHCETGVGAVPLLLPLVGLALLRKDHVLLHSSAFVYKGTGTLVTGWQKGGKTEMLLAFLAAGARYLADEWTVVSADGETIYGLPSILQVWSWHLRHLPQYWQRLTPAEQARLTALRLYQRVYRGVAGSREPRGLPSHVLRQLSLEGGVSAVGQVRSPPERFLGDQVSYEPAPLGRLFLATSSDGPTAVRPVEGLEVARRMAASLSWERKDLLAAYDQFRFAFPGRTSQWIEAAGKRESELLSRAFGDTPGHEVSHPYPVPLGELHAAAAPLYD